jgi:hypothetical protein
MPVVAHMIVAGQESLEIFARHGMDIGQVLGDFSSGNRDQCFTAVRHAAGEAWQCQETKRSGRALILCKLDCVALASQCLSRALTKGRMGEGIRLSTLYAP